MARLDSAVYGVNACAFLDTIAYAEGTSTVRGSEDGYNVLVGGKLFHNYERHPLSTGLFLPNLGIYSTAAGRYQILYRNWITYRMRLNLPDFGPLSQDLIAYQMIKERDGVLQSLEAGDFPEAVTGACRLWASLPGAGYGQHEVELKTLQAVYQGFLPSTTEEKAV